MTLSTRECFDHLSLLLVLLEEIEEAGGDVYADPRVEEYMAALGDGVGPRLSALSAVVRQADAQAALHAAEAKYQSSKAKASERVAERCERTMRRLLEGIREATGAGVVDHEGSRYRLRPSKRVEGPDRWQDWPVALLTTPTMPDPKPDKVKAARLLKAGETFEGVWLESHFKAVRS